MTYPNIDAIIDDSGNIMVGRVGGECVASASTSYSCEVRVVPCNGDIFIALLNPN